MKIDPQAAGSLWHPIALSTDLPFRHVFHAQLLGRELAAWRADDGNINIWENRCLHRGVRLSIGINDGTELTCQYHGWRYANRTAGCTYIPAHPADSPARTICNHQYPVAERYGLVWSSAEPSKAAPNIAAITDSITDSIAENCLALRGIPVNASISVVTPVLQSINLCDPTTGATIAEGTDPINPYLLKCRSSDANTNAPKFFFFLQPVDSDRTVIRGLLFSDEVEQPRLWLQSVNHTLNALRDQIELIMSAQPRPARWHVPVKPVSAALGELPPLNEDNYDNQPVSVSAVQDVASIRELTLSPTNKPLATWQPGAHIDVTLSNGLKRQYSLINAPGQTDQYRIAVKLEDDSAGGSKFIHKSLKQGDLLSVSTPRNNFHLRRDATKSILIAGGIGITPLLCMAQSLHHSNLEFELHYFVRKEVQQAFAQVLQPMPVTRYIDLTVERTLQALDEILADYQSSHHVYICGPQAMLDSARDIASGNNWPDNAIHFEYFGNPNTIDDSRAFQVFLARSGLTLEVPAGTSLLQALRDNGVKITSSCEQGACGTCMVDVIEGKPLHQDVYLSDSEKERGNCMLSCVSRAVTDNLVLDI